VGGAQASPPLGPACEGIMSTVLSVSGPVISSRRTAIKGWLSRPIMTRPGGLAPWGPLLRRSSASFNASRGPAWARGTTTAIHSRACRPSLGTARIATLAQCRAAGESRRLYAGRSYVASNFYVTGPSKPARRHYHRQHQAGSNTMSSAEGSAEGQGNRARTGMNS
jgi:hypothetical protein